MRGTRQWRLQTDDADAAIAHALFRIHRESTAAQTSAALLVATTLRQPMWRLAHRAPPPPPWDWRSARPFQLRLDLGGPSAHRARPPTWRFGDRAPPALG